MPRPYRERKKEDPANVKARHDRYNARKRTEGRVGQHKSKPTTDAAVALYRETVAARMPQIKQRDAAVLAAVKKAVTEADARAFELRHRGRPKGKQGLLLNLHRDPDALIVSVPQWQGER